MADVNANVARFMKAKDAARRLIQMDANGTIDNIAAQGKKNGSIDMSLTEANIQMQAPQESYQQPQQVYSQPMSNIPTNTKLPKEILESMTTKQIDTTPLVVEGVGGSILDKLNIAPIQKPQVVQQKQVIAENTQPQSQTVSSNGSVDYSMIKMIVEECMRKYTASLKKTILSESKQNGEASLQAMKIGNKFTFIDSKGNLYEAKLTKVKNIND